MSENSHLMPPDAIIKAWSQFNYTFPKTAFEAAMQQKEAITPHLLGLLDEVVMYPDSLTNAEDYYPSLYALYLLAWFREKRTLPILIRLFEKTGEDLFDLWGDTISEDGSRLFASWAFTEPKALNQFIEMKPKGIESYRSCALEAYIILYHAGVVTADAMRPYLQHLADAVLQKEANNDDDGWLWYSWARCCIDLGLEEMYPLVKQAYDEKWIDPTISKWEHEEKELQAGWEAILNRSRRDYSGLVESPIVELGGWYRFTDEARREDMRRTRGEAKTVQKRPTQQLEPFHHPDTIVNAPPKPKPNQPCPCGSGKKYKKCCWRK